MNQDYPTYKGWEELTHSQRMDCQRAIDTARDRLGGDGLNFLSWSKWRNRQALLIRTALKELGVPYNATEIKGYANAQHWPKIVVYFYGRHLAYPDWHDNALH